MKYYIHKLKGNEFATDFITSVAKKKGHELVSLEEAEIILCSSNNCEDITKIKTLRRIAKDKTIIVGGHSCVIYKPYLIYADIVWIGHCFEFFDLKSLEEIKNHKSAQNGQKSRVYASNKVEFDLIPLIRNQRSKVKYVGEFGCKNKCNFCLTSWTNKHQKNENHKIMKMLSTAKKNGFDLDLLANESSSISHLTEKKNASFMIKDYKSISSKYTLARFGIEFATEKTRKECGKEISDKLIREAIVHCERNKVEINMFLIGGIDKIEDWNKFFCKLPDLKGTTPKIIMNFNNYNLSPYTPLYRNLTVDRYKGITENYITQDYLSDTMNTVLYPKGARYRVMRVANVKRVLYRNALNHCTTIDEYNETLKKKNDYESIKEWSIYLFEKHKYNNEIVFEHKNNNDE